MKPVIEAEYVQDFTCIADRCSITCCQEWKIAVDEDTRQDWKSRCLEGDSKKLSEYVTEKDGEQVIALDHQVCPFLEENKLCRLVLQFGDSILSNTCTIFPREIHEFSDRLEKSMVSCCPEIIDRMKDEKLRFLGMEEYADTLREQCRIRKDREGKSKIEKCKTEDLLFFIRKEMMDFVSKETCDLKTSLKLLFYIQLDICQKYYASTEWRIEDEDYTQPETLRELVNAISGMPKEEENTLNEQNELFLDLVENYRKQGLYQKFLDPVVEQAEAMEELEDSELTALVQEKKQFDAQLDTYKQLFTNYIVAELFTNGVKPESGIESFTVMLQWIAMEYTAINHSLFLKWLAEGKKELPYETIRDYMVVVSRMTGYDEEDIYAYMENSFENLIWDWGYFSFMLG